VFCLILCPSLPAGVSDHGLRQVALLTQLESLNLDSREVTDAGLAHITSLARLRSLDLFGAKVTDRGCAHLRHAACLNMYPGLAPLVSLSSLCLISASLSAFCPDGVSNQCLL